jgi:hypothetical protein
VTVDASEMDHLIGDLTGAGLLAGARAVAVVKASAKRIEDQAKEWAPRRRLPHYARTITHDIEIGAGKVTAEIGPDSDVNRQANLAPIFEYGTSRVGPRAHMGPALDRETPKFEKGVEDVGGGLLR